MSEHCFIKVLEKSHVSPPPGSVPTTSLPLTFFDTMWFSCCHMKRLFFYEFPYPTSHFIQNTIPDLKHSLCLALQLFFPFAGSLKVPQLPQRPYIYYENGDFVPFVVAESIVTEFNFNHLIGGDRVQRRAEELERLVPELPPPTNDDEGVCKQKPLMAVQVTIFPNAGVSIGITFSHMAADGRAFAHFTKSWAAICNSLENSVNSLPPDYSRDLIQDPRGIWSIYLKQIYAVKPSTEMNVPPSPTDNIRISPVITKSNVEALKKWIARKFIEGNEKDEPRLSTFVVTIAFIWVCLIKLHQTNRNRTHDDEICYFVFAADCRERLRLPTNYFGNCLRACIASAKTSEMIAENGIVMAAKAIGREIEEFEKGALKGAESWVSSLMEKMSECEQFITLAGSPKLKVYETDFGFGRPIKSDVVHIASQSQAAISMAEMRDEEGGVEFGLALPLAQLHKFNAIFEQGLLNL